MAVYFLQCSATSRVKIGYTAAAAARIVTLTSACPAPLVVLAVIEPAGRDAERALHRRFKHLRLYREWFAPAADLMSFCASPAVPEPTLAQPPPPRQRQKPASIRRIARASAEIEALLRVYGCRSDTELSELHGYSRPTLSRWRRFGIPAAKREQIADKLRQAGLDVPLVFQLSRPQQAA